MMMQFLNTLKMLVFFMLYDFRDSKILIFLLDLLAMILDSFLRFFFFLLYTVCVCVCEYVCVCVSVLCGMCVYSVCVFILNVYIK